VPSRLILSLFILSLAAEPANHAAPLAVIVDAAENFSPQAWQSMQSESERLAAQSGLPLRFVQKPLAAGQVFADLVQFRFHGKCAMDSFPALLDERGPYAWAFTAGDDVLSFGAVDCAKVRERIKTALHGADYARADELLGRALARILAHELYHIAANTRGHAKSGIVRHALTPQELIAAKLDLASRERDEIRRSRKFRQ
jgi:hypothetical protein